MTVELPRPDPTFGHYQFRDGSRVYRSGVTAGLCDKDEYYAVGEVLMARSGIRYFDSVFDAARALEQARRNRKR